MIVSLARYRVIQQDTSSAEGVATGALVEAQALIEDYLDRPLDYDAAATETLPTWVGSDGVRKVWPRRYPVSGATDPATVVNTAVIAPNGSGFDWAVDVVTDQVTADATVTFAGGWLPADDPAATDVNRVLPTLERAVCAVAWALITTNPAAPAIPAVTTATVGDVSATFAGADPDTHPLDGLVPGITRRLARYRYRPIP